jgi:hypothetical protein
MLLKIDVLKKKGEFTEVDLDVFGEFDYKILEVYYWNSAKQKSGIQKKKDMVEKIHLKEIG